jgi:2-methylcitrate dehydratase PrpD
MVAGYEVYSRIGVLAAPDLLRRGFHPYAVFSSFGAAAVAAKLHTFVAETMLHALAIALSDASGITEYSSTGGSIKRIHAGIGTRNGMVSADMAQAGITRPCAFLSGNKGFFRTFLQRPPADGAEAHFSLDRGFEIATVWLKAYCAYCYSHAYIDALRPFAPRRAAMTSPISTYA